MCNKCVDLDKTIERYHRIRLSISDQVTVDKAIELIAELLAQKLALHPEETSSHSRRRPRTIAPACGS
jgi:hypothetical protein